MDSKEAIETELQVNEEICPEVLDLFPAFGYIADDYLNVMSELLLQEYDNLYYENMDIRITINLVREFLGTIDKKYLEIFEKSLNDGTFDLYLPEDDLIERPDEPITSPKPNASINIPVENTVQDGAVIIHEFFHYLNDDEELVGTREIFTEMISIYYELRYYKFLEQKGYSEIYFYNEVFERINSTYDSAYNLCTANSVLDIYHNTGKINKKNIKFLDKYRELYTENINTIIDFYKSEDFKEDIFRFREEVSYVIGTLLTFRSLSEPKLYDIKMQYINDNMNSLTIGEVLEILEVKLQDYPIWIDGCAQNLQKALGEIYGESNMYSGSYGSR